MIYFGIPLRSKESSRDWGNVVRVFNRSLKSVYSQTNPNFRVFVACHQKPVLFDIYDERVEFITANTPVPKDRKEMLLDKGYKVSIIAKRIKECGGGYTMIVDADDLVSNRLAEYADAHPDMNGFLSRYGYIYNDGFPYMKKILSLHRICGSCSIVNYQISDLPDELPKNLWDTEYIEKYIFRISHRKLPDYLKTKGRALEELPFPSTVYVRNTGDNHSMMTGTDLNYKRKIELFFKRKINIHSPIGEEFGLI